MTTTEHSEPKRSVYDTCDPHYLRQLREAASMDIVVLARKACMSVAQVRQLETEGSDSLFYSDAIKRQAYKRLLMILGAEPPSVELPDAMRDPHQVAEAHLNTLDQIVAMSHQPTINRSASDLVSSGLSNLMAHKQALGALLLLVASVGLFVLNGMLGSSEDDVVTAASSPVLPTPAVKVEASEVLASAPVMPSVVASVPLIAPTPAPATVVAASAPAVTPAASAASVAAVSVSNKTGTCAFSSDAMPKVTPVIAAKEGRYVYVVSTANMEVCVVDGNKQATVLQLKAGESRSVYGVSPWQVSSANLQKAEIYFQGGRVPLPDASATRMQLIEVAVSR
jgi:hypothetical protein